MSEVGVAFIYKIQGYLAAISALQTSLGQCVSKQIAHAFIAFCRLQTDDEIVEGVPLRLEFT